MYLSKVVPLCDIHFFGSETVNISGRISIPGQPGPQRTLHGWTITTVWLKSTWRVGGINYHVGIENCKYIHLYSSKQIYSVTGLRIYYLPCPYPMAMIFIYTCYCCRYYTCRRRSEVDNISRHGAVTCCIELQDKWEVVSTSWYWYLFIFVWTMAMWHSEPWTNMLCDVM